VGALILTVLAAVILIGMTGGGMEGAAAVMLGIFYLAGLVGVLWLLALFLLARLFTDPAPVANAPGD
jgi:hypothetical protein